MPLFRSSRGSAPRLGCFGKVPSYGDFVSFNAESDDASALATWLEEGVASSPGAPAAAHDQYLQFVWRPRASRRALIGVLWPSADAAGRRFPFVLFASHSAQSLDPLGPRVLIAAEAQWQRFHVLHGRIRQLSQLEEIRAELQRVELSAVPDARAVNSAYVGRVQPSGSETWNAVPVGLELRDLVHHAEELRGAGGLPDFALRIRLHSRNDPVAEAVTWLHVLLDNLGTPGIDAGLFVRVSMSQGSGLFVFHRDLDAADLPFLLAPAAGTRRASDVGYRDAPANAQDRAALEAFGRKWGGGPASLARLLEVGAQGWDPGEIDTAEVDERMRAFTGAATASSSKLEPVSDDNWEDDDEITGEVVIATPTGDPITGPVGFGEDAETLQNAQMPPELTAALAAEDDVTDDAVEPEIATIEGRIRALADGELLAGRVVRVTDPGDAGGRELLVYVDEGGAAAAPDGGFEGVASRVADHQEARALLQQLVAAHRRTEEELERLIAAACARGASPLRAAQHAPTDGRTEA